MEEKILVSSQHYNFKKFFGIIIVITLLVTIGLPIRYLLSESSRVAQNYDYGASYDNVEYATYLTHREAGRCDRFYTSSYRCSVCSRVERTLNFIKENGSQEEYIRSHFDTFRNDYTEKVIINYLLPGVAIIIIVVALQLWHRSYKLTVTDKRIYGTIILGQRVDLPLDSVSAVSTIGLLKGISIASSSGRISFLFVKNMNEIYEQVKNLLIERQANVAVPVTSITQEIPQSNADELKKYKELLDAGVITQEEFDAKKKQLLGI